MCLISVDLLLFFHFISMSTLIAYIGSNSISSICCGFVVQLVYISLVVQQIFTDIASRAVNSFLFHCIAATLRTYKIIIGDAN